jgi:uncharacterized repeat protein (TIGR02543 family)
MRKKLFIGIYTMMFILLGLMLSINQAFALDNSVYQFDGGTFNTTTSTNYSLSITESTQTFAITGTDSVGGIFKVPSMLIANANGSSLDPTKDYIFIYEPVSGSLETTEKVTLYISNYNFIPYQQLLVSYQNYNSTFGGLFIAGSEQTDLQINITEGSYNLEFKLHVYEYVSSEQYIDLFSSDYSTTSAGVNLNITDGNTITVNGTTTSNDYIDLSSVLTSELDPNKLYIYKYQYISGDTSAHIDPLHLNPLDDGINSDLLKINAIISTSKEYTYGLIHSGDIVSLQIKPQSIATVNTLSNFTYKILVEEIGAETTPVESFTVEFRDVNGDLLKSQIVISGQDAIEPVETPSYYGTSRDFIGWDKPITSITANTVVYAVYGDIIENVDALVNYYVDGVIDSTVTTIVGASLTAPTDPVKTGYTFIGWYLEDTYATLFDFSTDAVASETFNLYARFIADTTDAFTVSFNENGGSLVDDRLVVSGESIDAPVAPTKSGYTFNGWFTDVELTAAYDFTSTITADITLYAKWTESATTPVTPSDSSLGVVEWVFISLGAAAVGYAIFFGKKK